MKTRVGVLSVLVLCVTAISATSAEAQQEAAALASPGDVSRIEYISTETTASGYQWQLFRNLAYPCSISGYQTFAIGAPPGSTVAETHPLWVRLRGGGVGYFNAAGQPRPNANNMAEEDLDSLIAVAEQNGLNQRINGDPAHFRDLVVSMCDHDIFNGGDQTDPDNPNLTPDGQPRTSNGLFATKAAISFAQDHYPTSKTFLHGTSAGSFGGYGVAWSLQLEDRPVAGFVADSGVINSQYELDVNTQNGMCSRGAEELAGVTARLHPVLGDPANQTDLLVARGELLAPVFNIWDRDDQLSCGQDKIACTLADGSIAVIGAMECKMERISKAIAALPDSRHSETMRVCVRAKGAPLGTCGRHVVTDPVGFLNTDPSFPADYDGVIIDWVHERLTDSPPAIEAAFGRAKRLNFRHGTTRMRCRAGGTQSRRCQVTIGSGGRELAKGSGTVAAGNTGTYVSVHLTRAGRKQLRRHNRPTRVKARLEVRESYSERTGEATKRMRASLRMLSSSR